MKKHDIISAIADPGYLALMDIEELASLVSEYPCSDVLRMLYLRALQDRDDIRFEAELRMTAASVPSRQKLYHWLKKEASPPHLSKVKDAEEQTMVHAEPEPAVVTPAPKEMTAPTLAESEEVHSPKEDVEGRSEVIQQPLDQAAEITKRTSDPAMDDLQRQYLTEAVSISIGLDADEEVQAQEASNTAETSGVEARGQQAAEVAESASPNSFLDFLSGGSADSGTESGAAESEPATPREILRKTSLPADDLVERFLSNEKREKLEFFDPVRMAKQSLVDNDELVSETLARVYEHQGNLIKAIKTYESLQLKYPEKRLYFAGRIQRVKDLIDKR